jgi:hypothetical protein
MSIEMEIGIEIGMEIGIEIGMEIGIEIGIGLGAIAERCDNDPDFAFGWRLSRAVHNA